MSATNSLNSFSRNNKELSLKGFTDNLEVHSTLLEGNAKISHKSLPKIELLSFKLALQHLYQVALKIAVRKELKYMPLKLTVLGDSLCLVSLFLFPGKRSVLQNNMFNIVSDLLQKNLRLLPRSFINFSYVCGELNPADQNSK